VAGPLRSEGSRLEELRVFDLEARADGTFSEEPLFVGAGGRPIFSRSPSSRPA
jgi:hypothetical protein